MINFAKMEKMDSLLRMFETLEKYFDSHENIQERSSDLSILIRMKSSELRWKNLSFEGKQAARRDHLSSMMKRVTSKHLIKYYDTVIYICDAIYDLINKIEIEIIKNNEKNTTNHKLLILLALLTIEKDELDKLLIPNNHLNPIYFKKILKINLHNKLINSEIVFFTENYFRMYDLWEKNTQTMRET